MSYDDACNQLMLRWVDTLDFDWLQYACLRICINARSTHVDRWVGDRRWTMGRCMGDSMVYWVWEWCMGDGKVYGVLCIDDGWVDRWVYHVGCVRRLTPHSFNLIRGRAACIPVPDRR